MTGGNQFYPDDMDAEAFLHAVSDGIDSLERWAADGEQDIDYATVAVHCKRVGDQISVTVEADLVPTMPPTPALHVVD